MIDKERLGEIKRVHEQIIESNKIEMETGSLAAGDVVHDCLFELFSAEHTDWLIEQAERSEELEEQQTKNDDYTWELLMDIKRYREALEFYANKENWKKLIIDGDTMTLGKMKIEEDCGNKAQKALEETE